MAIICWPDQTQNETAVLCSICHRQISLISATAGLQHHDGTQAFACNDHFASGPQLINGWADFTIEQHRQQAQLKAESRGDGPAVR